MILKHLKMASLNRKSLKCLSHKILSLVDFSKAFDSKRILNFLRSLHGLLRLQSLSGIKVFLAFAAFLAFEALFICRIFFSF